MTGLARSSTVTVQAAGGVLWRRTDDVGLQVLLVHRPRYDDWTLPKGKLEAGEQHVDAAVREVREETGLVAEVGPELPSTHYRDRRDRPKVVRYWAMTPTGGRFVPGDEVDEVRWCSVHDASAMLTYVRDVAVLDALAAAV